jgi:hypothetical protein
MILGRNQSGCKDNGQSDGLRRSVKLIRAIQIFRIETYVLRAEISIDPALEPSVVCRNIGNCRDSS